MPCLNLTTYNLKKYYLFFEDYLLILQCFCNVNKSIFFQNYMAEKTASQWVDRLWAVERLSGENLSPLKVVFTLGKNN